MFNTTHLNPLFVSRSQVRALEAWREAASVVRLRWQAFLEADAVTRQWAFASYVAALDAEEAAAAEMAALSPSALAA
jgi:hypothetical protein